MELLSPAGNFRALQAALTNGADAVYFGGSLFNARLGADNFDNVAIKEAISLCHRYNAKAYITMNTLTHDRDLLSAVSFAAFLYENGADAVIVQDLGLVALIRRYVPDLEIHASTQMGISSLEGVELCGELGIKRVVLSRELALTDIKYIHDNSPMPLEVFVHGAMCMSFSGGCLFSSMVGGRSGNCGSCAQPCRKYGAIDHMPSDKELALSLGDLCMLEHIDDLRKAGAMSLKIEGRMKKPEYIAATTYAYRRAIDGAGSKELAELKRELFQVFSRGEFTTGYYYGDNGKTDRIAIANPTAETLERIRSREVTVNKREISFDLTIEVDKPAILVAKTDSAYVTIEGVVAQVPKKPITEETVKRYSEQLSKLGDTGFIIKSVNVTARGFVPISEINSLRRTACDRLSNANERLLIGEIVALDPPKTAFNRQSGERTLTVRAFNYKQAVTAFECGVDEVIVEYGELTSEEIALLQQYRDNSSLGLALPISLISQNAQNRLKKSINSKDFDLVEINNLGQLEYAREFNHMVGGIHLNVFNAYTAEALLSLGLERLTLSVELNAPQIRELLTQIPGDALALFTYGKVPLMNLYHCPIKEHIGCDRCKGQFHKLIDGDKREFAIVGMRASSPCDVVRLYNCYANDITGLLNKLVLPKTLVLSFVDEESSIVRDRILAVRSDSPAPLENTTRGYFRK